MHVGIYVRKFYWQLNLSNIGLHRGVYRHTRWRKLRLKNHRGDKIRRSGGDKFSRLDWPCTVWQSDHTDIAEQCQ